MSRESGTPFTVTGSASSLSANGSTQFADKVGTVQILGGHDSTHPYFSPAAFADPSVAQKAASGGSSCSTSTPALAALCRFGTAGRNSLRGPGLFNLSASVARTFAITERFSFIFRAESFNLTNTPQFNNPSANVSTPSSFGIVSGVAGNSSREMRFSGRVTF